MKHKHKWTKKIVTFLSATLGCLLLAAAVPAYASEESTCKVTVVDEFYDDDGNLVDSIVRQEDEVKSGTMVHYMPTNYVDKGYLNYDIEKDSDAIYQETIIGDTTVYYRYVPGYCKIQARYLLFDVTELTEDEIYRIGNTYWEDGNDEELNQKLHSDTSEELGEFRVGDTAEIKAPHFEGYKVVTINTEKTGEWSDIETRYCSGGYIKAVLPDEYKTEYNGVNGTGGSNGGWPPTFLYVLDTDSSNTDVSTEEESYTIDISKTETSISADKFAELLTENATKAAVIKSNNNVTFTFAKGTMSAIEGVENYDFGTVITTDYAALSEIPTYVTQNNFVSKIHFNYSGKLPATASITFYAGTDKAGQTLYYYLCNADKSTTLIQSVVVDGNGYVTVKQDHCSDYILTTEELKAKATSEATSEVTSEISSQTKSPKTGDNSLVELYISMMCVSGIIFLGLGMKKRAK